MTMLPREQVVTVPLDAGLDTGTDPQTSTAMAVASNVTHPRRGAVAKRAGQARSAAAIAGATRITRLGSAAVAWGGTDVRAYDATADASYASSYDATERAMQSSSRRIGEAVALGSTTPTSQVAPSLAMGDAIVAVVYGGRLTTYSRSTLTPIDSIAPSELRLRVLRRADGSIIAIGGSATGVRAYIVGSDGVIGSPTTMSATGVDALAVALAGSDVYVVARSASVGIVLGRLAGGAPGAWTQATIDPIGGVVSHGPGMGLCAVAGGIAVAWSRQVGAARGVTTAVYDSTLASIVSAASVTWSTVAHAQQVEVIACARVGAAATAVATVYAAGAVDASATALRTSREYSYTSTAGVGGYDATATRDRHGAILAAAPMVYSASEWYVPWYSEAWGAVYPDASTHQGMVVVSGCGVDAVPGSIVESSHYRPVASVASGYARQPVGTVAPVASDAVRRVAADATQGWAMLVQVALRDVPLTQRGDVLGLRLVEVWPSAADGATVEHSGAVLLPGALPRETDGIAVWEQGWLQYPEPITLASSSAGALVPGSEYRYVATYEQVDALGRRHSSAPTPLPLVVIPTSAADALPSIHVGPLAHSLRGRRVAASGTRRVYGTTVYVVLWRTLADGSIYYRLTDAIADYTTTHTAFGSTDALDATIAMNEVLPTTGGVLAGAPPPPYVASTMWQGRHVVVDTDRQELRYSRSTAVGAPVQHALELAQPLRLDGTVTALDALGGRLIIMTDRAIYATDGAGYDDIGQGQPLADPYLISSLVGCSDARSVARLPQGIAFLGGSRIWLLDSGLALQPIGEAVRYYTTAHTYRDAVPLQTRTSIAWTSATGPALVYDAVHGRWSTWDTHTCVGACASASGMLRLASDYRVWRPAADTAGDDGAWVTMDIATGWLAISDWQRVAEIEVSGYYVSRCAIRLRVQYDYVPVDVDDSTYTPAANGLLVSPSGDHWGAGLGASYLDRALRIAHAPSRTQCSALRVRITDAREGSEALGAGAEWATVRVRLQPEAGMQRLDRSRRTG